MSYPLERPKPFADGWACNIVDETLRAEIRRELNGFFGLKAAYRGYPGAQPVPLSRAKMAEILLGSTDHDEHAGAGLREWRVAKKSDGIRLGLAFLSRNCLGQPHCVIVDRGAEEFRMASFEGPQYLHEGTFIDGELIRDPMTGKHSFFAFDLVAVHGMSTCLFVHSDRLKLLQCVISDIKPVKGASPFSSLQLKAWYPLTEWARFLREQQVDLSNRNCSMTTAAGAAAAAAAPRDDEDDDESKQQRCHHPFDGLVLAREHHPLLTGTDHNLIKVKDPTRQTVDFFFVLTSDFQNVELYVAAPQGKHFVCRQGVQETDALIQESNRDRQYPLALRDMHHQVVECAPVRVGPNEERWRPVGLRPDKQYPNTLHDYESTVRVIRENISLGELHLRISGGGGAGALQKDN